LIHWFRKKAGFYFLILILMTKGNLDNQTIHTDLISSISPPDAFTHGMDAVRDNISIVTEHISFPSLDSCNALVLDSLNSDVSLPNMDSLESTVPDVSDDELHAIRKRHEENSARVASVDSLEPTVPIAPDVSYDELRAIRKRHEENSARVASMEAEEKPLYISLD